MNFRRTFKKVKRAARHWNSQKALRRKLGLTADSKFMRQLKRSFKSGSVVAPSYSTSASTEYRHNAKTLSQLTGGV